MIDSVQVPWGKGEIEPRALLREFPYGGSVRIKDSSPIRRMSHKSRSNVEWNRPWNFLFTSTWRRKHFVTMVPFAWWVSKFKMKASLREIIFEGVEKSRMKYSFSFYLKTRKHVIEPWTSWNFCKKKWRTAPVGVAMLWDDLWLGMKG